MKIYSSQFRDLAEARQYDPDLTKGMSWKQIHCIEILTKWGDGFSFTIDGKRFWKFYFDDGVFKGGWNFEKRQKDINPAFVCSVAETVNWPGLKGFLSQVDDATLKLIKQEVTSV